MGLIALAAKVVAVVALYMSLMLGVAFAQAKLPWQTDSLITLSAEDEDIKDVLRTILRSNRMVTIFKGAVEGTIDLDEEDVPAQGIFNKIITEFDLQYVYDKGTQTVTIQPKFAENAAPKAAAPVRDFVAPQYAKFSVIQTLLKKFGLGSEGVTYDESSGTISLFGFAGRIQEIKLLIARLDESAEDRQKRELNIRRSKYENKLYKELLSAKVKVIPLRYASVSETTKSFQGKTVSVPGIEETLQAILGVQINRPGDRTRNPTGLGAAGTGNTSTNGSQGAAPGEHSTLYRLKQLTRPNISVDRRTNSVIVRGSEAAIAEVEEVIRQLDQPQKMLEIQVIILTASKGVTEQLGLDYRALRRRENNKRGFGIDTGTSGGSASATSVASDSVTLLPTLTSADLLGSFIVATNDNFLQIQLAALSANNKSQIVASPKVITLDNVTASITRNRSVFAQVAASGDDGQDLKEIQTGLRVDILPTVVPSDISGQEQFVRLSFNATNSAPTTATFGQVEVSGQEIQTEVLIPDGGTYVVGGLFDDARAENVSGVPLLRELPVIGQLFRTNESTDALSETIFLITPRIVQPDDLLSKDMAARVGTREYMKRQQSVLKQMKSGISKPKEEFPHALRSLIEDE